MKSRLLFLFALVLACIQAWAVPASRDGQPVITANVETVAFGEVEVGYPVTMTFKVTGHNLVGNINLEVTGSKSSYYKVTPQSIAPQEANIGVYVTVKCSPVSAYISPASILLTSENAEDLVIPITVSAYYPEDMFVNNQTEQFTAKVGQIVTHKGTIRFADAEVPHDPNTPVDRSSGGTALGVSGWVIPSDYSLSIEGADSDQFSARIVKASAISKICTVSVSYVPRSEGSHQATLNVYCSKAGVPLVTVRLRGETNGVLCDFDHNGELTITDLTDMIDLLLTGNGNNAEGDFDGNGKCDIDDVTRFISYLLGQPISE